MTESPNPSRTIPELLNNRFLPWMLLGVGLFLYLFFWEVQPTVWIDETAYLEPALNWVKGAGFVSSAWYQSDHSFWSGNVPLQQVLLAGWFKIFGVSEFTVRTFGYFTGLLGVGVFLLVAKRLGLFIHQGWLAILVLLFLLTDGTSFSIRSGRTDTITILLAALQWLAVSLTNTKASRTLLLITGVLVPWAALQLLVYIALVWMLATAVAPRRFFVDAVIVATGTLIGLVGLLLLYYSQGTMMIFWNSIHSHTAAGGAEGLNWKEWLLAPFVDRSAWFLIPLSGVLSSLGLFFRSRKIWRPALAALLSLLLVPLVMKAAGAYKLYYSWMALVPGILFVIQSVQACNTRWLRAICVGVLFAAMMIGLPLRLFFSTLADPLPLKRMAYAVIEKELKASDWVVCHSKFYYPVKARAEQVYSPAYLRRISPEEMSAVSILILDPDEGPWPPWENRENWHSVAQLSASESRVLPEFLRHALQKYMQREINLPMDMVIYRRNSADNRNASSPLPAAAKTNP